MYARETAIIATPIGTVRVWATGDRVASVDIGHGWELTAPKTALLKIAITQLEQWFAGDKTDFDLPLAPIDTDRGNALRQAIIDVPYGELLTYGALAQRIGSSARAIGQACARNPLPIIVPCHRIVPSGGKLGAYSGGDGPATKRWLIDHEARHSGGGPGLFSAAAST